jgi:hypothetical protein
MFYKNSIRFVLFCLAILISRNSSLYCQTESATRTDIIVIPVVVHNVYSQWYGAHPGQLVPDAQILSEISALNKCYRKITGTIGDGDGVDCLIEFRLANLDPDGNPTNGITRTMVNGIDFWSFDPVARPSGNVAPYESIKHSTFGIEAWDVSKYLNIWIADYEPDDNHQDGTGGTRTAGYATLPFEMTDVYRHHDADEQGLEIDHHAFGENVYSCIKGAENPGDWLGLVPVHEIGHFFGLFHPFDFGCPNDNCSTNNDKACDTPPEAEPSWSCSSKLSCNTSTPVLIKNYMDYSKDICRNSFTLDQLKRMNYFILNSSNRNTIPNSSAIINSDFILFGNHYGSENSNHGDNIPNHFNYVSTSIVISGITGIHSPFWVLSNGYVDVRARSAIILHQDSIKARQGAVLHMFIDPTLPTPPSYKNSTPKSQKNVLSSPSTLKIYPNPTSNIADISYSIPGRTHVELTLFDILGHAVKQILVNDDHPEGEFTIKSFDLTTLSSGTYYCRLTVGNDVKTEKIVLSK